MSIMGSAMSSDQVLRLSLAQLKVEMDKPTNIKNAIALIEKCVNEDHAEMVVLPECFNLPYGTGFFSEYSEVVPGGNTCQEMAAVAKKHKIWLVAGSIPEKGSDGKLYNTSVVYNPEGEVVGTYRKAHLFDIDIPGKISFHESDTLSPGSKFLSFKAKNKEGHDFTVGMGICYDMRFPELALIYARQHDCDLLIYPGAFNTTTGPVHWELLARSRALDTQCYVAACSPAQDKSASYVSHAESLVVSPWGAVLANAGKDEGHFCVEVSRAELDRVRSNIPIRNQLRKDMYSITPPNPVLRLSLAQLKVGINKPINIKNAIALIEKCVKEDKAEMVILPECFNSPYGTGFFSEYSEIIPEGNTCQEMAAVAKKHKIWLVAGSIPEKGPDGKLYNTSVVYNPEGEVVGTYRKVHLFDIDIPGKISFHESDTLSPGSKFLSFKAKNKDGHVFTVGMGICYDIRFPELALIYARQRGCDLLIYPGAFNATTGPVHWELLARGRALDAQCYVAACSPAQDKSASYVSHAESLVVSPWGTVLANAGKDEGHFCVEVSRAELDRVRSNIPIRHQLRKDMYSLKEEH